MIDIASFGVIPSIDILGSSGSVSADSFLIGAGVEAVDANDYFLYDTALGYLKFDSDGSGSESAINLVKLVGVVEGLTNNDIYVAI